MQGVLQDIINNAVFNLELFWQEIPRKLNSPKLLTKRVLILFYCCYQKTVDISNVIEIFNRHSSRAINENAAVAY